MSENNEYLKAILSNFDRDIREVKSDIKKLYDDVNNLDKRNIKIDGIFPKIDGIIADLQALKEKIQGNGKDNVGIDAKVDKLVDSSIKFGKESKYMWKVIAIIIVSIYIILIITNNLGVFWDRFSPLLKIFKPF